MPRSNFFLTFVCIAIISAECSQRTDTKLARNESKLLLVNVVFRHGDRTPDIDVDKLFPTSDSSNPKFYPDGAGQLTNRGKQRVFRLGQVLRKRYNDFLGYLYTLDAVKARTTSIIRSKMSLLLLLAGLYPPESVQEWNPNLNWQPINTINIPLDQDGLLLATGCQLYTKAAAEVYKLKEVKAKINEFNYLAEKLTRQTSRNITFPTLSEMYILYHTFVAITSTGDSLPAWTKNIFPEGGLRDAAILQYQINSYTAKLNRLNGGVLLHRMISDMATVINGTSKSRKINLYSTQDITVAAFLQALGVYDNNIPEYCSAVILELHAKNAKLYYVRLLYHLGIPEKTIELKISGCDAWCPFERFVALRKDATAAGQELQCDTPEPMEA